MSDVLETIARRLADVPTPDPAQLDRIRSPLLRAIAAESPASVRAPGPSRPLRRLAIGVFVVVVVVGAAAGAWFGTRPAAPAPTHPGVPGGRASAAQIARYIESLGDAVQLAPTSDPILPPGTGAGDRLLRPVVIDGGQMGLAPAPAPAALDYSFALATTRAAAAESGIGRPQTGGVLLARVWIASDLSQYDGRLSFVAFTSYEDMTSGGGMCEPAMEVPVFDASSERDAVVFYDAPPSENRLCRAAAATTLPATELVSVPWIGLATERNQHQPQYFNWAVRFTIPACGGNFDERLSEPATTHTFGIVTTIPLDPGTCRGPRTLTVWFGPQLTPLSRVVHQPVGIVAPQAYP
jgi:hypothetical protein